FTPEYAARRADVPRDDLGEAARVMGTARRGGTGGGTGVSMTSASSLVSYLLLCINSVRGFWARAGDRVERPNVLLPPNRGMTQVTERSKYHTIRYGFSEPYAHYTPALLGPPADSDLIEDWQLFYRVGKHLGLSMNWLSVFGSPLGHMEAPLSPIPLDMERE